MPRLPSLCLVLVFVWLRGDAVFAQDGLAKKYIQDLGIQYDPAVVFADNFENGTLNDVVNRWSDRKNVQGMALMNDIPPGLGGLRSLQVTSLGGANTGGHLYTRLGTGYDQLYFRYYIKYASQGTYHHSAGYIGGYNPGTDWVQGGSGTRPNGNDRVSAAVEPFTPDDRFDFYVYWMRMRGSQGDFWGNDFIQDPNLTMVRDQWTCVEIMIKLNNPVTSFNGELAVWVNGQKVAHLGQGFPNGNWVVDSFFPDPNGPPFEGFQWRNDPALTLNWIMLQHYATQDPGGFVGKIWVDHVVVAKSYIGPVNTSSASPSAPRNLRIVGGQ